MSVRFVVVGNPDCRRVEYWKAATSRLDWVSGFTLLTYADLLENRITDIPPGSLVRIETPGGDWETFKLLLKHGTEPAGEEGYPVLEDPAIEALEYDRGWLVRPRQAHLGFLRLLKTIGIGLAESGANVMQSPQEIAVCYDKPACQTRLDLAGIPIPERLGSPKSYDELLAMAGGNRRILVKLANGSGAAGCVAIHRSNGRAYGITTVARLNVAGEPRLYCSKRPVTLQSEKVIADLVDRLCIERVQAEVWLPKARWEGCNIDLRVVTIDGEPRHTVVRSSPSVFTNLTLGSQRADTTTIMQRVGAVAWNRMRETCASVATAFPNSFTLGIDVLIRPDWERHNVLEVNAFGDLLMREFDRGEDTYTASLNAWNRRFRESA